MKERQADEGRHISPKPRKEESQQNAFNPDSPSAAELIEKGALSREQSIKSAQEEEEQILERKKREWSAEASQKSHALLKEIGDITMENLRVPLNRRGLGSADKKTGGLQGRKGL